MRDSVVRGVDSSIIAWTWEGEGRPKEEDDDARNLLGYSFLIVITSRPGRRVLAHSNLILMLAWNRTYHALPACLPASHL